MLKIVKSAIPFTTLVLLLDSFASNLERFTKSDPKMILPKLQVFS